MEGVTIEDGIQGGMYMGVPYEDVLKKMQEAHLGFMAMNVYEPVEGTLWGKFNNRDYKVDWVNQLSKMFTHTIRNCTDATSMAVAIKKEWVSNLEDMVTTVNGKKIEDVPEMKILDSGKEKIKTEELWMLSGNHRRQGLTMYLDDLRSRIDVHKETVTKLKKEIMNSASDEPLKKGEVNAANDTIQTLERRIASCSRWAIEIYDRGAWLRERSGGGMRIGD